MQKNTQRIDTVKSLASMWVAAIAIFCVLAVAVRYTGGTEQVIVGKFTAGNLMIADVFFGSLAFFFMVLTVMYRMFVRYEFIRIRDGSLVSRMASYIAFVAILAIFPLSLSFRLIDFRRWRERVAKKEFAALVKGVAGGVLALGLLLPVWTAGYYGIAYEGMNLLGYVAEPQAISGTGSMYPTFPKGEGKDPVALSKQIVGTPGMFRYPNGLVIAGKRFFAYTLHRGDIVVAQSPEIAERTEKMYGEAGGWVKRIIGLPKDTLELRGGIVYRNGEPIREPYTASPQSTFGETFLGECKTVTVPDNSVFLMGDNRKGSGDSRDIGFVSIDAIRYVIPFDKQKGVLDAHFRDTANDFDEGSRISLNKERYVELLNEKRKEAGVAPVRYAAKLEESAKRRGKVILQYDDFSFEATRSGYTMARAMSEVGYGNVLWGEAPAQGYYEAEELIENQFQFPQSKKFLLDHAFDDIGIAEVQGTVNGCPTQVIVQHFGGYVPPNYSKEVIDSWNQTLRELREIQPGWNQLKEVFSVYDAHKEEVNRINEIIAIRISRISGIVARMNANQWLTPEQNSYIEQDKALYDEQERLATKLNSY
ncbi:MAG: signal peptidase I [Patescibacteria group bacterium]